MRMFQRRRVLSDEEKRMNAEARAKRENAAMHCQCCGRKILANTGVIAHHGYERPGHGWQTGSCMGARYLPFEASRTRLGEMIEFLKTRRDSLASHLKNVRADKTELTFSYTAYPGGGAKARTEYVREITRTNFEEKFKEFENAFRRRGVTKYEDLKEREVDETTRHLKGVKEHINEAQKRFDGWKETHRFSEGEWRKLEKGRNMSRSNRKKQEQLDEQADAFEEAVFNWLGLSRKRGLHAMIEEGNADHNLYIKFMSNGGGRDDEAGTAFQSKMREAGIEFEAHRLRSAIVNKSQLSKVIGADWPEEC